MNKQLQFLKIRHAFLCAILLFSAISITTVVSSARKASLEEQEQLNTAASMILLNDSGPEGVNVLDLRGTLCYPQLDKLVSCGEPDTLSILLFTKSETPIDDIIINLEMDEGLQYAGFAEIGSVDGMGMSLLDSLNVTNSESPFFSLSELSQAGGGVVLTFGIQAQCGHDFVANPPGITVNLDYPNCVDEIPLDPIATEPLTPEVVFTGAPGAITITTLNNEFCMTQNITQVTLDASTGEATLTISDFGFPDVSLDNILVDGATVPASDIMIDANGVATIVLDGNANPDYFGGDGILNQNEISAVQFCFSINSCPVGGTTFNPPLTIAGTCNGILCGGLMDSETTTLLIRPNFGTTPDTEYTEVQLPSSCDAATGLPAQYIFDISTTGTRPEEIEGSLYNLQFLLDECPGGPLVPDSVQIFTGGSATGALVTLPLTGSLFSINANGRLIVSLRALKQDFDGPGGLTDIDGDGNFDDVLGSDEVRIRIYLGPLSCAAGGGCGQDDSGEMQTCQFFRVFTQGARDCGLRNVTAVDNVTPLPPPILSNSVSQYSNIGMVGTGNNAFPAYNFGVVGNTSGGPVSSTINIDYDYSLDPNDFSMCPAPGGDFSYEVIYLGDSLTAENLTISNLTIDGNPASATTTPMGTSVQFEIPFGDGTPGMHNFNFDLTLDTFSCGPAMDFLLITRVVESCPTCVCSPIVRTCQTAIIRSDLDDFPNCTCDYDSFVQTRRLNLGFTDRTETTPLTMGDFPGVDNLQLDQVLPGDTVEFITEFVITNAVPWNGRTERIGFNLTQIQGASTNNPNSLGRLDQAAARIQTGQVIRGATVFDMINIQPAGNVNATYNGIKIGGAAFSAVPANNFSKADHPAFAQGTYTHGISNSGNDFLDGTIFRIYFWGEDRVPPGELNGIQALYDLIGGEFEDGDTIRFVTHIPVKLTPDLVSTGDPTTGPLNVTKNSYRMTVDARDLTPTGALSGNFIGGGSVFNGNNGATACVFQDTLCFHDPQMILESTIDYSIDVCAAEIIHNFTINNPLPGDWYNNPPEYRPIVGLERLFSEFPEPYIYNGGATYEKLDGAGPTAYEPDSILSVDTIGTAYCAANRYGQLYFVDEEFTNGVRAIDYDCYEDDTDISLSGGTFPLVGVGGDAIADPDTLQFRIPIIRLCTDIVPETPVEASFLASYTYLADYRINTYLCNNGLRYGMNIPGCNPNPGTDGRFYWPWERDDEDNPHRFVGNLTMTEIGVPVPSVELMASVASTEISDMGGGESNVITICPVGADPITAGVVLIEFPVNVTYDGSTPPLTEVLNTGMSTVYSVPIPDGTPAGACFDFEIMTSLVYCGPDEICTYALPCDADPTLILAKDLDCLEKICYSYRAGQPEIQAGFNFPVNPAPCATNDFEINFGNTGSSFFTEVDPVLYFPDGMTPIVPFTVELTDAMGGTTSVTIPAMAAPALSGVPGNAYTVDLATLAALLGPEGFEPSEGLTFMFSAELGCTFVSGAGPAALFRAEGDCEPFEFLDRGQPINTIPPSSESIFEVQSDELQINCTDGGAVVLITTLNAGKVSSGPTTVCLQLPEGISIAEPDIDIVAPTGYTLDNFMSAPIGGGGATSVSFDGPSDVAVGGFFCLELALVLDSDQECGILEVGFQVKTTIEVICPLEPNGNCSMEQVVVNELLPFEVVPAASVGDATLSAGCNDDPTMTDLEFEIILESIGEPFNGNIVVDFFFDLDQNGMVDSYDTPLGSSVAFASIPVTGDGTIEGEVTVPADAACAIVAKLSIPGCACSMIEIPFPEIIPSFLDELGESVAVCPNEPFVFDNLCGDIEMVFDPPAAGTVVIDDASGTATAILNPGFGVDAAVTLVSTYSIGSCPNQEFTTEFRSVGDFDFGPYTVIGCAGSPVQANLDIPIELQEDIQVTISPSTYLDDPNSTEPTFIEPLENQGYTVDFSVNGQCMASTTLDLIITQRAEITIEDNFDVCDTIFDLAGIVTLDPDAPAVWMSEGDGAFIGGTDVTTTMAYDPGPMDIANGMVTLVVETDEGQPCGVTRQDLVINIVVDTIPPMVTCPNDICVPNDMDWCGANFNLPIIPVEDNCTDDANLIVEYNVNMAGWTDVSPNNQFFPNDTTEIGIRVIDEAGNVDSCFFNFIVKDKQAPEVICSDLVINLGETGNCDTTIDAMDLGGLSADECELADVLIGLDTMPGSLMSSFMITGLVAPVDTTFEFFVVATDTSGNQSFCLSNVRILCGVPPAPAIGLAKRTADVDLLDNGCVDVTYELNIQNYGNVELTDIVLTDDLTAAFASCASFEVDEITSDDFIVNGAYDGAPATSMLLGLDTLQAGDKGAVLLTVQACGCADGDIMNTASVEATDPDGTIVEDDSTDGSNPDGDGDGDPTNDGDPTITSLMTNPSIGGAKRVADATLNPDGSFVVLYEINIENYGDVSLADIQAMDDLAATFPAPCAIENIVVTSDDFTVNTLYDGVGVTELLTGADTLQVDDKGAILLEVTVAECAGVGPFENEATVSGTAPDGTEVDDDTVNGSDPDGDGDGDPTNEDSPTPFTLEEEAVLGVAKYVKDGPTSNGDGTFNISFGIRVENLGNVNLSEMSITDDLVVAFAGCDYEVSGLSSEEFAVNLAYDGAGDTELLDQTAPGQELKSWDEGEVCINIVFGPCANAGPFMNSATAMGTTPAGDPIEDDSQNGSNPDPDGDGDPTNNDDPTGPITFPSTPSIGGAKRVADATLNPDGSFVVLYEINIENYGDVSLADIQAMDDLAATFPAPCAIENLVVTSDDFTVNPLYDGVAVTDLLTGSDTLQINDKGAILIEVTVAECAGVGPFENEATVSGTGPDGTMVVDDTVNGSEPDGDGDGDPTNDDSPTPFTLEEDAVLGVAKYVKNGPINNSNGTYSISFGIRLENLGNVNIEDLSLTDDLVAAFAGCDYTVSGVSSEEFAVNVAYDGSGDTELLADGQELKSWDEGEVCVNVVFGPCDNLGPFMNSATVMGTTPAGDPVEDDSQSGSNPDPDGDGDPTNNDDGTPFEFEENGLIGLAKRIVTAQENPDGTVDITYEFNVENFGDVPILDLQVMDDLNAAFAPCMVELVAITSDDFIVDPTFSAGGNPNMLLGDDILEVGDKGAILIDILVSTCAGNVGPFMNQAEATGTTPSGDPVSDLSDNGSDPDGDNDGDPTNDDDVTIISFDFTSFIGLAKDLEGIMLPGDGSAIVDIRFVIQNYGTTDLDSINLFDDVATQFAPCDAEILLINASPGFVVNPLYDGGAVDDMILTGADNELLAGESGFVFVRYRFTMCGDGDLCFCNQGFVTALDPLGGIAFDDLSQSGTNPDPDGDLDPTNNDECTEVKFGFNPAIGIAKRVSEGPISDGMGCFDVTYEINVENLGDQEIYGVQVVDDLSTTFGLAESWTLISAESEEFMIDPTYDGLVNQSILLGNDTLGVATSGDEGAIYLKVNVCPGAVLGPYENQAFVDGTAADGTPLDDASQDGSNPDPDFEDDATDNNDVTPVSFEFNPLLGGAKRVADATLNPDGSFVVLYEINIENYGDVSLADIQAVDDLSAAFPAPCSIENIVLTSDDFTVNPLYDGVGVTDLLTGADTIQVNDKGAILLEVTVAECAGVGPFVNTATVSGTSPDGMMLEDDTVNGSDPDGDGDGDPTNDDSDTPFTLEEEAVLGVAKYVKNGPINNGDGTFSISFGIRLENIGNVNIEELSLTDDLVTAFAGCDYEVTGVSSEEFAVNLAYDGDADPELLDQTAPGQELKSWDEGEVCINIVFGPCANSGPFMNSATAMGTTPAGDPIEDDSQNGSNPDPDGDGDPTNNDDPTGPITFPSTPSIGGAKRVADAVLQPDGSFVVIYEINIENFGDVSLADIQATDDLAATFPAPCAIENLVVTSDDFTVNPLYDGVGVTDLLTGADTLQVNDKGAILIEITVAECAGVGPFVNSATVSGTGPDGTPVEDDTVNGSEPDGDGDGDPTNDDSGTPFTLEEDAVLGVAKYVKDGPINNGDGTFSISFGIRLENLGNVNIGELSLTDDLVAAFAGCDYEVSGVSSEEFAVNLGYDGDGDTELIDQTAPGQELKSWDEGEVCINIVFGPCSNEGPFMNSATAMGTTPAGDPIEDDSQNGSNPDPDGDGDPTNNDDPTGPITFPTNPDIGIAKREVSVTLGDNGCYQVTYEFNIENIGDVSLNSVQVEDDLAAAGFGDCGDFSVASITSDDFVIDPAYDGNGNNNMLLGMDDLPAGDKGAILLVVEACACPTGTEITNTATVTAETPAGDPIDDDSSPGSDVDPGDDGEDDTDENDTTNTTLEEDADFGLAKRVVSTNLTADGCTEIVYEFNIENLGNVSITDIQVEDDLAAAGFGLCGAFTTSLTSDEFTVDPAFDGMGNNNLLVGLDNIVPGDVGAILLTVEACGCPDGTMIGNTATLTGTSPGGDMLDDNSVDGSDPDPGDDGEDGTDEMGSTDFEIGEDADFGLAKRVVTTNLTADGCTAIIYEFNVENLGNVNITDIQVTDDLTAAGFGLCGEFTTSLTSDEFTVNPGFDGMGDVNLLLGLDNIVPGDVGSILLTVEACGCPNGTMIGNTATLTGTSPGGDMLDDNSVDGSDPDPDGNGEDGTDEMGSTDFEITEAPDFGVAKREVGVWLQDDGCALVTYEINVENLGNVEISGLQVEDNLVDAGFGVCAEYTIKEITSDDFLVNGGYDGDADDLLLAGTDILEVGDKGAILFTVEACGCPNGTDIANSATGTGMTPAGDPIDDVSTDGSDPDPDGMGESDTDEMGTTNTDLDVIPSVGIAKRQVTLVNNDDGSATVTYEFNIENFGNIDLQNIQATDDLATIFAPCNDIDIISITSDDFTVNGGYNGVGDLNMLVGDDDLPAGDQGAILLTINVDGCGGDTGPFMNQATLTADSPDGTMLMDLSQDGSDPDPDGDGDPTNNDDPTETEFEFMSFIGIAKAATQVINNADGSSTVTFEFNVENFGNQILTELQVVDNLGLAFSPCADIEILSLTSDDYQVNVDYDGVTDLELLAGVDDIDPGDVGGILLTINVDDCMGVTGTFINSAFVSAVDPAGMDVFDDFSQNGTNPDPDGDGDPTNNDDGTPVDFGFDPDFGVAKRLSYGPILSTEGCYDITFEIKVENFGDVDLANIQVEEDLTAVFGAGDIWSVISLESEEFDVNTAFDGIGDTDLLSGLDTLINQPGGNEGAIYLGLNVCPDGMTDPYLNSVTGSATAPDGTLLSDVSQDGSDPDPDGNGDPSDNNDPTPFQLMCEIPMFTNCPRPPVILDAPEGWCSSFANFSPPLAEAECGLDTILKVDMTGLDTGDLFPVGTTILKWVAIDIFGNVSDTCIIKVVVNDFHTPPTIECPIDVAGENDPAMCGAVINDIAPPPAGITDNCPDNIAVTYMIADAGGGMIGCGVNDASGYKFPVGTSTVTYKIQDQPILLISEIIQDGMMTGVEITNFGPASYDISCLVIGREGDTPEEYIVDDITIVGVGDVFTQIFTPIAAGTSAGYYIGYMNNFIDAVSINGYISANYDFTGSIFGDNIVRNNVCDTDSSEDWFATTGCDAGSFGMLNPGMEILPDNGTTTSLQSEAPSTSSCSFTVTIEDTEAPYCAEYDTTAIVAMDVPLPIMEGACTSSTISIGTSFQVGDVNVVGLIGSYPDMGGITATLVSPSGTEVVLFSNLCSMTADYDITLDDASINSQAAITCTPLGGGMDFQPIEALKKFFGEEAMGDWSLEIYTAQADMGTLEGWMLEVSELAPYSQVDTCISNDLGLCSAEFTWMHPRVGDNCCIGTIEVAYTTLDDIMVPADGPVDQGTEMTAVFEVGTTTVTYTITDEAGNISMCSFDIVVKDDEAPVLDPASCQDLVIQLDPGECDTKVQFPPLVAMDNCGVDSIQYTPGADHDFEIGVTDVTLVIFDAAGNSDTCMFTVTVLEFIPDTDALACNNQINLSLGPDCTATITADMILEGDIYGCYDDYCVTIRDEFGNEIGTSEDGTNVFDLSHVGMTFEVEICIDCTDQTNCCWGYVTVEEKLLPDVECPADTTIMCNEAHDPIATGEPIVMSCEPDLEVTYVDDYQDNGLCGNPRVIIDRTWTITDADGNSVECLQQIIVLPFDLNSVEFPDNFVLSDAYDCSDVEADPTLTDADNTGYPTINGKPIFGDHFCEVNVGFWDERLEDANCLGSYEILRNWIIRDECLPLEPGVNPRRHIQAIKVNDTHAPVFAETPIDITVSTDVWNCHASYTLDLPEITDDCGVVSDIIVNVEGGSVTNNNGVYTLTNMVHGDHNVRIRAGDQCHNYSEVEFNIHVEDRVAPNVICIAQITVSLTNTGHAKLFPESIDDGSFDNCGPVFFEVYRMETSCGYPEDLEPGEFVNLCCSDIGDDPTLVVLRVWDDASKDGIYGNFGDNFSECMVEIKVEDKNTNGIGCPPNVTITCDQDYTNLDLTGAPSLSTVCDMAEATFTDNLDNYNQCGIGYVLRTWSIVGENTTCVQRIDIDAFDPFQESDIVWPADYTGTCMDDVPDQQPTFSNNSCNLLGVNVESDTFYFESDACYKVLNEWTVIDWCTYDADNPNSGGIWTDNQVIKILDDIAPVITDCGDKTISTLNSDCILDVLTISNSATDNNCGIGATMSWYYQIDFDGDGNIDDTGELEGSSVSTSFTDVSVGTVTVIWVVTDGCGNSTPCTQDYIIEDGIAPEPYCIALTSTLGQQGSVELWATDFDQGSTDNCTPQDQLIISFTEDGNSPNRTFTCDDLPNGVAAQVPVEIWIIDAFGNASFCNTSLTLTDNNDVCEDQEGAMATLEGNVLTEDNQGVNDVHVTVEELSSGEIYETASEESGHYGMSVPMPVGIDYMITPARDDNHLNGVSTLDVFKIQRHVLGIEKLDSPYKLIAADVNNSESVSAVDLVELQKIILGYTDEFPANTSWRFVNTDYEFGDETDPWPFEEVIALSPLLFSTDAENFVGVKVGDVNGSANPQVQGLHVAPRTDASIGIRIVDRGVEKEETVEVILSFEDVESVSALQGMLKIDTEKAEVVEIDGTAMSMSSGNFGPQSQIDEGMISFAWTSPEQSSLTRENVIVISLRAKGSYNLSELISMEEGRTPGIAYEVSETGVITEKRVELRYTEEAVGIFAVAQNTPNPFTIETEIYYEVPVSGTVDFKVMDVIGKVVMSETLTSEKGENVIVLKSDRFPSGGVYHYEITYDGSTEVRKMILVK